MSDKSYLRPTRIEIQTDAIGRNMDVITRRLRRGVRWLAVVKADAYGHGADAVLRLALNRGAWGAAVATPEEGIALRQAGYECPILVLGAMDKVCAEAAVEYDLSQVAPDAAQLRLLADAARRQGRRARAHIKLDTGMGRIGVRDERELNALLDAADECRDALTIEGVLSHFARADEPDAAGRAYTDMQARRFERLCSLIQARGYSPIRHICNSAGIDAFGEYQYDMVRAGVSMYGYSAFGGDYRYAQRWVTRVLFKKRVPAGEPISYGGTFVTRRETELMTLPVGYADGYLRAFGGRAQVLVCGRRADVVGRVCMDQIMVDVTDIPQADVGCECVLLGDQGDERITPVELAEIAGTIPYEIMLLPRGRVPRVYV